MLKHELRGWLSIPSATYLCYDHLSEPWATLCTWALLFQLPCSCLQKAMALSNLVRVGEWMMSCLQETKYCRYMSGPRNLGYFSGWFCLGQGFVEKP